MGNKKILLIDDDLDFLEATKIILESGGNRVVTVPDGNQGLEKAREEKPDLIILDIMLPDKDGFSICRELKDNPETCQIPILILTAINKVEGKGYADAIAACHKADDFMEKPVSKDELSMRISKLLVKKVVVPMKSKSKREILVVDNDAVFVSKIKKIFESHNFKVSVAESGLEALKMAQAFLPELVLLEVILPDRNGYSICYELKKNAKTHHIPVIILSAIESEFINPEYAARIAVEHEADGYLVKPIEYFKLLERIEEVLSGEIGEYCILVINPGSTSTEIGVYKNMEEIFTKEIQHSTNELAKYPRIVDQYAFRRKMILDTLVDTNINLKDINCCVGRGGLLRPIPSGVYRINDRMLEDLKKGTYGMHASNLGAILAQSIAEDLNIEAFIVDPVVVDELSDIARISGIPEIERRSVFHALNHKAVGKRAASEIGKTYEQTNLIVAHLGGGITIGAHRRGRVVDVNDGLHGEGPLAPTRSGGVPAWNLVKLALSGKYAEDEMRNKITGRGGVAAYFKSSDMKELKRLVDNSDKKAKLVYEAMAYQAAKEIGACAAVLEGDVDAVVISGGIARDKTFVNLISERVSFIAKVLVYPGSDEMKALAMGAIRVLTGEEKAKDY